MAKPIFLIGFPMTADLASVEQVRKTLHAQLHDYHVLVYKEAELKSMEFKVLNSLDSTDIEINELIEKTSNFIKSILIENKDLIQNSEEENETIS